MNKESEADAKGGGEHAGFEHEDGVDIEEGVHAAEIGSDEETVEIDGDGQECGVESGGSDGAMAVDIELRAAVDAGFCDHDLQIGQTGVTVHPKVYIACGISGQIQHLAGMQDSKIIISINTDPNAPINTIADYVITGSVEDVLPRLIKYYKEQ